ncbi:MAG: NAD(P)-binding protein [Candidatus Omnitrophica bacterium]|nr:NAD(P)-binding protein [Candidatus Omnitrophota bacterium]
MRNSSSKIIILGAGLSGISAAYSLRKLGMKCRIFEKEPRAGGLCKSTAVNGFTFDYCGHLLHFRHKHTLSFIKGLLKDNLAEHKRDAKIYSFKKFTRYPFQVNLYGLPHSIVKKCLVDFIKVHTDGAKNTSPNNFLQWCYKNFGDGITKYFMLPYNNKFWTTSLDNLSYKWVDGFVVIPTLRQVIEGTIEESKRNLGYHSFFWYPENGGIEELIKSFLPYIEDISTEHEAVEIDPVAKQIRFKNGAKEKYDILISTIPLPELSKIITKIPKCTLREFKNLKWVSIFNLNLGIRRAIKPGWHWIYFPENEFKFFRVGFYHNFSSSAGSYGKSSLYIETSYSKEKPLNRKNITGRIIKDLIKARILTKEDVIEAKTINDIKYAYPMYDCSWETARSNILKFLNSCNIFPLGRFGGWQYMSMEDVVLESMKLPRFLPFRKV